MEFFGTRPFRLRSDSGLSSCSNDTLSSKDLKVQPSDLPLHIYVGEKVKQMEQMIENIKAAKEQFLKKYMDMNKKIDLAVEQVYFVAEARKQELEAQVHKIADMEVLSWNRQLKVCEEVEHLLRHVKTDFSSLDENLQKKCNMYARDIGFIRSAEISFDDGNVTLRTYFENVEGISHSKTVQGCIEKKVRPKFCIGKRGKGVGEFSRPWGVCTDPTGRILVADRGNNRVQIFNEYGKFLLQFGKAGTCAGEFNKPVGLTVDKTYRIIVTDKDNHRVQVFTFNGKFMFMFGRKGCKPGEFQYPWDVDTNSGNDIVISDTKNHRVQLFSKNGMFITEFKFVNIIRELNQCIYPLGVAFKPDGTLLVTDIRNRTIFKVDEKFLTTKVQNYLRFCTPQGVACDNSGKYMVADGEQNRVLLFDDEEKPDWMFGVQGKRPGEFDNPQAICFHPNGSIIVTDFGNNRIQVF